MTTRLLLLAVLTASPVFATGTLTITGDKAEVARVGVRVVRANDSTQATLTLPANAGSLVVTQDNLLEYEITPQDDGRTIITAVFPTPFSSKQAVGLIELKGGAAESVARTNTPDHNPPARTTEVAERRQPAEATDTPGSTGATTDTSGSNGGSDTPGETAPATQPTINLGGVAVRLPAKSDLEAREFSFDAAIPESPAAAVIGSSAALVRFNESKDASTQLLNIADKDGRVNTGFSFAFHPYRLLAQPNLTDYLYGRDRTLAPDLRHGRWIRFLSRLDVSLAATVDSEAGPGGTRGATGAFGLSGFIFHLGDSRVLATQALLAQSAPTPTGSGPVFGRVSNVRQVKSETAARIMKEVSESAWNNSYWAFGVAPRFRSDTGNVGDFHRDGGAAWTTLGYGFEDAGSKLGLDFLEDNAQLLLHASYRDNQKLATPAGGATHEDVWIYGAQFRLGRKNFNAFGEVLWEKHRPIGLPRHSSETYYVGFEKKLKDDLWLQVAIGSEETPVTTGRSTLLRTALSYAFGDVIDANTPRGK